jgi:DNA mismatch repair protein MutS2
MNRKSVELLEFDKIRAQLLEYCFSTEGPRLLVEQPFLLDLPSCTRIHNAVAALRKLFEEYRDIPALSFPDIDETITEASRKGSFLEGVQLYSAAAYIHASVELKQYLEKGFSEIPPQSDNLLLELLQKLDPPEAVMNKIFSVLEADGSIKESHPELRSIRKRLGTLRRELISLSSRYMNDNKDLWQTDVPSQKDGRTVLPLKAGQRGKIEGIVHDVSAKGSTLYVEPFDILEKNNEVALQEHELRMVVIRILRELTQNLRDELQQLTELRPVIAELDTLQARSRYSRQTRSVRPEQSRKGLVLKQARHPLLGKDVVPVDISLDETTRSLIISGPNAGGKTVTLKTIGLLAMMNQFGIQIPAAEGSSLPLFQAIYVDIGDDQSIEASLSTFSGHMKNISEIIQYGDEGALVLLDELGSGTDPAEGSVLAMAILEELLARNTLTVCTSHHGLLKNYGYTREGAMNASMDFDETSHLPTYRVLPGVPGESHAFDIARRSGMPETLLMQAEKLREDSAGDVASMIRELERETLRLRKQEQDFALREKELREEIRKSDLKELKIRQREHELQKEGYKSLDRFIKATRKELENLVRELREGEITREKTVKVKDFISSLENRAKEEEATIRSFQKEIKKEEDRELRDHDFNAGDQVYVSSYRKEGLLVRKDKAGLWLVAIGPMKVSIPAGEIKPVSGSKRKVAVSYVGSKPVAALTIDVRGMRLEEAIDAVSRQIDGALVQGIHEFAIIHGTGEGVLQQGVQDYLRGHSAVKHFNFAHPEEGGAGKTVVRTA